MKNGPLHIGLLRDLRKCSHTIAFIRNAMSALVLRAWALMHSFLAEESGEERPKELVPKHLPRCALLHAILSFLVY